MSTPTWPRDVKDWPTSERECRLCGADVEPGQQFYLEATKELVSECPPRYATRATHAACLWAHLWGEPEALA